MIFNKLREAVKRESATLPPYIIRFNRTVAIPFLVLLLAGPFVVLACCIPLGLKFEESVITFIPLIAWGAVLIVFAVIYAVFGNKITVRYFGEYAAELETEFVDMPFDAAVTELMENGILNDEGFLCDGDGLTDESAIPFNRAKLAFGYTLKIPMCLNIYVGIKGQPMTDNVKATYALDKALYNFIVKGEWDFFRDDAFNLVADENFELFKKDKKEFIKKAYKDCKKIK